MQFNTMFQQQPAWPGGVFAWHPGCYECTWVWFGGRFKLKFVHAGCREHGRLLGGAS